MIYTKTLSVLMKDRISVTLLFSTVSVLVVQVLSIVSGETEVSREQLI